MTMTNAPIFRTASAAAEWRLPLPAHHVILAGEAGYSAAAEAVADAVADEIYQALADVDSDDDTAVAHLRDAVNNAVNEAFWDGITHDEWCAAALRRLRAALAAAEGRGA
jgi:hypothetical protein